MFKQLFSAGPLMAYPLVALGLFVTVFVTRVVAMMRQSKEEIDRLAQLPLTCDQQRGDHREH